MKERISQILEESLAAQRESLAACSENLVKAAGILSERLAAGGKILIFGNGGSAADSQHIAAEFVNRFARERTPLAALALTTDTSVLTAVSNDYSYEQIFAKQVAALGRPGDVAWGISTSGTSGNVLEGLKEARKRGLFTLGFSGKNGGPLAELSDICLAGASSCTPRVQESHLLMAHILCELVEDRLFPRHPGTGKPGPEK